MKGTPDVIAIGCSPCNTVMPYVQWRGDSLMVFYQGVFASSYANRLKQRAIMMKARQTAYNGELSDGARKRLNKSLSLLIQASRPRWIENPATNKMMLHTVSFCTLTIGSRHDPIISTSKAKLLLEDFLQWLYHTKGVRLRVWKMELQKRGQPHFHIVFPDFIHYKEIRKKWNEIQHKHGTIDGWAENNLNFDPPSTEIKKAYSKGSVVEYLCKEMSKETSAVKVAIRSKIKEEIEAGELEPMNKMQLKKEVNARYELEFSNNVEKGKIWDCSEVLSQMKYYTLAMSNRHEDFINDCIAQDLCLVQSDENGWWQMVKWKDRPPPGFFDSQQKVEYDSWINEIIDKAVGKETFSIPVECLEVQPDEEKEFSIEQLSLFLN